MNLISASMRENRQATYVISDLTERERIYET